MIGSSQAIAAVLAEGVRTADLGGVADTAAMTEAVLRALGAHERAGSHPPMPPILEFEAHGLPFKREVKFAIAYKNRLLPLTDVVDFVCLTVWSSRLIGGSP